MKLKLLLIYSAMLTGCAAHSAVEPIGKGGQVSRVTIGGPIVAAFGNNIPVPYLAAGTEYGVSDRVNVGGDVHILPLFYEIAGGEIGGKYFPVLQHNSRPTVGIGGRLLILGSFRSGVSERLRVYPILSITAAWKDRHGQYYIGNDLTLPFGKINYDESTPRALHSPFVGYKWNIGRGYALGTELKWQASNIGSNRVGVDYVDIQNRGAIATLFSLEKRK